MAVPPLPVVPASRPDGPARSAAVRTVPCGGGTASARSRPTECRRAAGRGRTAPAPSRGGAALAGASAPDRGRGRGPVSWLSPRCGLSLRRARTDLLAQLPCGRFHAAEERPRIDPAPQSADEQRDEDEQLARRE